MLLLWCLYMIQVFSYPLGGRSFSSPRRSKASNCSKRATSQCLWNIILFCQDHVIFSFLIRLAGVSCPLVKFFPFCQVLPPFSTGVLSQLIFIVPCTSRFNRSACMYFLYIVTLFLCLSTYKVLVRSLVSLI